MQTSPGMLLVATVAAVVAALSLGPSFAHVLEAPPRLYQWSPELWRETTVFNGQFRLFATIGAPLDIAAIILPTILAVMHFGNRPAFDLAIGTAIFYAAALIAWASIVAPANAVLATWAPGPLPTDFEAVRFRWETGHMVVAGLKLGGFILLALSLLRAARA